MSTPHESPITSADQGSVFPYPGGKARLASWIQDHLAVHETYVEPFGGAAAVLFSKRRSTTEVYNDADGDVVHFFSVLRDRREELVEWLRAVPYSRELYREWTRDYYYGDGPDDPIERAGRWFTLRYMQFGAKYDGKSGFNAFAGCQKATSFKNQTERLDAFADRLRGVIIEQQDYGDILDKFDSEDTLFYLDPPYAGDTVRYQEHGVDHARLLERARDLEGEAIISAGCLPENTDGFHVATKDYNYCIRCYDGQKDVEEALLMTYDPDTTRFAGASQTTLAGVGGDDK